MIAIEKLKRDYELLKARVEQLEQAHPDIVVQVIRRRDGARAVLRRVVLNKTIGLLRLEKEGGSFPGNANWDVATMDVVADGLGRSGHATVEFVEVPLG
jgi:hypothetical protein